MRAGRPVQSAMGETAGFRAELRIEGVDADLLTVTDLRGREALSTPYGFDIGAIARHGALEGPSLPGRACCLTLAFGALSREISGLCWEFEQESVGLDGLSSYRLLMTPRLQLLALSRQSLIYGGDRDWNTVDIVRAMLLGSAAVGPGRDASLQLPQSALSLRLTERYPERPFVVQFEETDLGFFDRILEHDGIFYFFEEGEAGERLVLADDPSQLAAGSGGPAGLPYRPAASLAAGDAVIVQRFEEERVRLPAKVVLTDYDEARPSDALQFEAPVDAAGHGVQYFPGEHFRSAAEGQRLARLRAGELSCRKQRFFGSSNAPHLAPGQLFSLEEHEEARFNRRYLVTAVEHRGSQRQDGGRSGAEGYENRFEAIPDDVRFVPQRRQARPLVPGLLTGRVGGSHDDGRGEVDGEGRYRVQFDYDLSGRADGRASPPLRRVQPSGGENAGMHFPLARGTEIALACIDGDPDRPVILGAVSNPATPDVAVEASRTVNRIRTAAGTTIDLKDGLGNPGLPSAVALALGKPKGRSAAAAAPPPPPEEEEVVDDNLTFMRFYVVDQNRDDQETYLRLGAYDAATERAAIDEAFAELPPDRRDGLYSMTDGASLVIVGGDQRMTVEGNQIERVRGSASQPEQRLLVGTETRPASQRIAVYGDRELTVGGDQTIDITGEFTRTVDGVEDVTVVGSETKTNTGSSQVEISGSKIGMTIGIYSKTSFWDLSHNIAGMFSFDFNLDIRINATVVQLTRVFTFMYSVMYVEQHPIRAATYLWGVKMDSIGKVNLTAGPNLRFDILNIKNKTVAAYVDGIRTKF